MSRFFALALLLAFPTCVVGQEIISETEAARHGLTRVWYTQVQVSGAHGNIGDIVLDNGTLFVQTDQAILQAIDAETGKTLWVQQVGDPHHPTLAPAANNRMVAAINGSNLFIFNRYNGKLLWKTQLPGAPGAGPSLSQQRVYVPMTSGLIVSYRMQRMKDPSREMGKTSKPMSIEEEAEALRLEQRHIEPLTCQSLGRTMVQPLVTRQTADEEFVAWPTDEGYLCIGRVGRADHNFLELRYRLQTEAPIVSQPAYLPPNPKEKGSSGVIFVASQDGFAHAVREKDGQQLWRYSTGEPISQAPVAVEGKVYVINQLGGMHCLDAEAGSEVWWAPNVWQFLAAGKDRLYVADRLGRLLMLDAKSGARLDTIAAGELLPVKYSNSETDRIFLATKGGMIQCLREVDLKTPLVHRTQPKEEELAEAKPAEKPVVKESSGSSSPVGTHAPGSGGGSKSTTKKKKSSGSEPAFGGEPTTPKKGKKGAMGSSDEMMPAGPPAKGKKSKKGAFGT